jgi:hypothetical protein
VSTEPPAWWPDAQTPRASADRIASFLDTFGTRKFRHADELVPIMRRNDVDESFISCHEMYLDDRLRRLYRLRAGRPASVPPSPHHPPGLTDDVRALADQLDVARDQKLQVWSTLLRSGTDYSVFVLMDDADIAGCVKSADQRIVNPPRW